MHSIADLSALANTYTFNPQVSFASWAHVSQTLIRESRIYDAENEDIERAYVLYLRFSDLVLNKLRKHPQFSHNRKLYMRAYSQLPYAIERSEALKNLIEEERKLKLVEKPKDTVQYTKSDISGAARDSVDSLKAPRKKGELTSRREALTLDEELELVASQENNDQSDLFQLDSDLLSGTDKLSNLKISRSPLLVSMPSVSRISYPEVFGKQVQDPSSSFSSIPSETISGEPDVSPGSDSNSNTTSITSTARLENGKLLRQVFIPTDLRQTFLKIAQPNTHANLETCGMLCGHLKRNAFFVTDLLIPHQKSTADSCDTTNEEELFEYVDSKDLFIIGWIHTHPTQTCFMSSVDLHTHASYQLMLPEAVAIVCAPSRKPDWGAFRLTDPPGITVIRNCKLTGFHPHKSDQPIYKSATNPGHYREIKMALTTRDLRSKLPE